MRQLAPQLENLVLFFSRSTVSDFLWPHGLQHARLSCPSSSPRACSDSYIVRRWCHPTISSSVNFFSSHPQSFPTSGSFPMSWLFASSSQSIRVSASVAVFLMNLQDWFPSELTLWSPCSPRNSQKSSPVPQFESINSLSLSLLSGPTLTSIYDYWKNSSFDYMDLCQQTMSVLLILCLNLAELFLQVASVF